MRLPDLVNQVQRKFSEGTNIIRHPFAAAYRQGRKRFQGWYENAGVPGQANDSGQKQRSPQSQPTDADSSINRLPSQGSSQSQISASRSLSPPAQPLASTQPVGLALGMTESPSAIAFADSPAVAIASRFPDYLHSGDVLQGGWWGRYRVEPCIQDDGWMRLYDGVQVNGEEPVWIYEYLLLEEAFNTEEAAARRQVFRQLVSQNLRLGSGSDFRLVRIKDVIIDAAKPRHCYLVTKPITGGIPLSTLLAQQGAFSAQQVRQVLHQVLQSLQYLHETYRVRWFNDTVERGLIHGNLTLDSLWIRQDQQLAMPNRDRQFFVYLVRFALWEHLCWPPDAPYRLSQIADEPHDLGVKQVDLADLGRVAFYLLCGSPVNPLTGADLSPAMAQDWPLNDGAQALKPFIFRLLGISSEPQFNSADIALRALQQLPDAPVVPPLLLPEPPTEAPIEPVAPSTLWVPILLGAIAVGSLLSFFLWRRGSNIPILVNRCQENCRLADIQFDPPSPQVTYAVEPGSTWQTAFFNFIADAATPDFSTNRNQSPLEAILNERANLTLSRRSDASKTPIELIRDRQVQVALLQNPTPDPALASEVVAYDGIVVFVAYSDAERARSVPQLLDGKIALDVVGQLFGGETSVLEQGNAQHPVRLYFPEDAATTQLFKRQLLAHGFLQTPETENQFSQLRQVDRIAARESEALGDRDDIYARLLKDFESQPEDSNIIGIGFDRLSRVVGQCSVYPLVIEAGRQTHNPLVEANGQPITPMSDLCGDKGSYWANSAIFENGMYPFAYDLAVVHLTCELDATACQTGQTFAEMLRTDEGQYLLSEVGLVPITPIDKLRRILWAGQ